MSSIHQAIEHSNDSVHRKSGGLRPSPFAGLRSSFVLAALGLLALWLPVTGARAENLTSTEELSRVRELADRGVEPFVARRAALLAAAGRDWRWGSVSGEFVTTRDGVHKRCHPASDPERVDYLKEGAPDAYAKVLGYLTASDPESEWASEARARVLDLVDTSGFRGLGGEDQSASNQCILELGISIPVWIETASLLEHTPAWSPSDRSAFARWLASEVYPRVAWASLERRNNWGAAGSAAASLIAGYVEGEVSELGGSCLFEDGLSPPAARKRHDAQQLERIRRVWRGDTRCDRYGIQPHGGIPDELRRGRGGCDATSLPSGDDASHAYQTMHVELLVLHAEAQRRHGLTTLFDARGDDPQPAILRAILFVIDNPSKGGRSWPWGARAGALAVAHAYYGDPRLDRELERSKAPNARGGRAFPYARLIQIGAAPQSSVR
jgi:hypothetical protein